MAHPTAFGSATDTVDPQASQADRARFGIRGLVLSGAFQPGERLTELALVDRLGVSRTPVRAALRQLANEGLLEATRSGGYAVRQLSPTDIADAIDARGALEGLAARLAAERGVPPDARDAMARCLDDIDDVLAQAQPGQAHLARYAALNVHFHTLLVQAACSPMLEHALQQVSTLPFAAPDAFVAAQEKLPESLDVLRLAQAQHRDILRALQDRSSARVEPLVREHARNAHKNLELVLRNQEARAVLAGLSLIRSADA